MTLFLDLSDGNKTIFDQGPEDVVEKEDITYRRLRTSRTKVSKQQYEAQNLS